MDKEKLEEKKKENVILKDLLNVKPQIEKIQKEIEILNDSLRNLNVSYAMMNEKIMSLNDIVDVYKRRDLEQTCRIRALENDEKFDYIKDMVEEMIRVREIVYRKLNSSTSDEAKDCYSLVLKHLDVSLSRCNVTAYSTNEGEDFNPEIHLAQTIFETKDKKKEGKVYKSSANGYYLTYTLNGQEKTRIINYEKVIVYEIRK